MPRIESSNSESGFTETGVTAVNKTYVFRDPLPLRYNDWDYDILSDENMFVPIKGTDDKQLMTVDEIAKDPCKPVLAFTAKLYAEIRYMADKLSNSEFAVFLTTKQMNPHKPHWLAFDFVMPGQTASGGGVSLDGKECDKYFERLAQVEYYKQKGFHRHIVHLHSHASFGVFWSGVDDKQQLSHSDLGFMDAYRLYVVVNAKGDIKCSYVSYDKVINKATRTDAAVVMYCGGNDGQWITAERKKELDELIAANVTSPAVTVHKTVYPTTYVSSPASTFGKKKEKDEKEFSFWDDEYMNYDSAPAYGGYNRGTYGGYGNYAKNWDATFAKRANAVTSNVKKEEAKAAVAVEEDLSESAKFLFDVFGTARVFDADDVKTLNELTNNMGFDYPDIVDTIEYPLTDKVKKVILAMVNIYVDMFFEEIDAYLDVNTYRRNVANTHDIILHEIVTYAKELLVCVEILRRGKVISHDDSFLAEDVLCELEDLFKKDESNDFYINTCTALADTIGDDLFSQISDTIADY